jgi:hypothetical protein
VNGPRLGSLAEYVGMRGDQVVVVPNGTYRGGEANTAHPATSGPYKGWLVLVAQSPRGAVIDMRDAPLTLGSNASRVLFVGFKFVNGSIDAEGNHLWFWHTEHTFPQGAWNRGVHRSPDAVHAYSSSAYDIRFYGSDVHDVCDGFDVSNSNTVVLQGVHIWDTYGVGDACHDDAIDAVQGNSSNLTVLDSWIQGRVMLEDDKGPLVGMLFQNVWVSESPSAGFTFSAGGAGISGERKDIFSWGHNNGEDVIAFGRANVLDSNVRATPPPGGSASPHERWRWGHAYGSWAEALDEGS